MPRRGDVRARLASRVNNQVNQNLTERGQMALHMAKMGDVAAQFNLARYYLGGTEGFEQNSKEAFRWLKEAAERGDKGAQFNLGTWYFTGTMGSAQIPQDKEEAFRWFQAAAKQGHPAAQQNVKMCLQTGIGVRRNEAKAEKIANQLQANPAVEEDPEVQYALAVSLELGIRGSQKDERRAMALYESLAAKNYPAAQTRLGMIHMQGRIVPQNDVEAARQFQLAAEQGGPKRKRI